MTFSYDPRIVTDHPRVSQEVERHRERGHTVSDITAIGPFKEYVCSCGDLICLSQIECVGYSIDKLHTLSE